MKIVLCPGHEKNRSGAVNKKYSLNEYDEAKKVITFLKHLLFEVGHDVHVIEGKLSHKVEMINKMNVDLAIDLHFNADADHLDPEDFDDTRGHGAMVMYCPKSSSYVNKEPTSERRTQADAFAFMLSNYIGNRSLGGRPGWYWGSNPPEKKDYFLRKTNCAAFIPEPGYIDNNKFAEEWLTSEKHEQLAVAIFLGIQEILE